MSLVRATGGLDMGGLTVRFSLQRFSDREHRLGDHGLLLGRHAGAQAKAGGATPSWIILRPFIS